MSRRVRVRFAPSPTGPLHIGGVRTALFNYLFARQHGGDFILRIEDTDQARFVPGAEAYIIESLKWCGLTYDEGTDLGGPHAPYRQSERKEIYVQYAEQLVRSGSAYYAFDTPEVLDAARKKSESSGATFQYGNSTRMEFCNSLTLPAGETEERKAKGEPYVIRYLMPADEMVQVTDRIRGQVEFNTSLLDDKVLFKSEGLPTYHLANVVDDFLMQVTHVIRGEEWLPSLPLHVLLYRSLGWADRMPEFAHLPLILKPSGQGKLSKRDGDKLGFPVFPLEWKDPFTGEVSTGYRESGYLPEAMVNLLALLGWNPGTDQEIFSMEELVKAFGFDRVGKSGARFDPEKAKWFNQQYMKMLPADELAEKCHKALLKRGIDSNPEITAKISLLLRDRLVFPADLAEQADYFFKPPAVYDEQMKKKVWKEDTPALLLRIADLLSRSPDFKSLHLEETVKSELHNVNVGPGEIMAPLRLLLVGSARGPHLFDIMELLGREETLIRIEAGLNRMK